MKISKPVSFFVILLVFLANNSSLAQFIDRSDERVKTPLELDMKRIGTIQPRNTTEIESSRITVGCETLDRDLAVWDNYKAYLKPLGVKKIRLQAGWAKCEQVPGKYDWKWLDEIIDFAIANGLEVWLQLSYGNPAYEGGGGTGLLNSLMTSDEAYAAWDLWVEALVSRYKDRVVEWEIWNEPDHPMQKISPETTARLNIRTAEIIKSVQADAKIAGLAFASNSDQEYLDRFLNVIEDEGKLGLFHWISYHCYTMKPESAYTQDGVLGLQKVIGKYSETILLRQEENGAPSTYIPSFALSNYYWTEYTQAKYDLRRLLGDLGHDIETSVFTIIDIYYKPVLNTKGLIQSDITMSAIRPKVAYYAIQNLAAVFDDKLVLNHDVTYSAQTDQSMSVYAYMHKIKNMPLLTLWLDGYEATNSFDTTMINVSFENVNIESPVLVDLMTGSIYEIPEAHWNKNGKNVIFTIPLYDSPMIITERNFFMD